MGLIRVLHIITGMGSGGAEAYIMNMYRNIDRTKVQFDFLLRSCEVIYEEEIKKLGGRIFYTSEYPRHFIKNKIEVEEFFKSHKEYKIIHVHGNALIYVTALKIAKKYGIPCRIMHSHNTDTQIPLYRIIHKFNKLFIKKWATDYFACSQDAGKWMFNTNFLVKKNAIDIQKFQSNKNLRSEIRKELDVENRFVIGNIARFLPSKNHTFLIKVFKEYQRNNPDSVLLLVGSGPLENDIKNLVCKYGLLENVKFLGVRDDINRVLQAFDIMVFPSLFEGFGIVVLEAQAAGVPCVISSNIPDEVIQTSIVIKKGLDESINEWVKSIDIFRNSEKIEQKTLINELKKADYDIKSAAQDLQSFYLSK